MTDSKQVPWGKGEIGLFIALKDPKILCFILSVKVFAIAYLLHNGPVSLLI